MGHGGGVERQLRVLGQHGQAAEAPVLSPRAACHLDRLYGGVWGHGQGFEVSLLEGQGLEYGGLGVGV